MSTYNEHKEGLSISCLRVHVAHKNEEDKLNIFVESSSIWIEQTENG